MDFVYQQAICRNAAIPPHPNGPVAASFDAQAKVHETSMEQSIVGANSPKFI